MTNKNNNRNQPHTGSSDTEFGAEAGLSKKARKKAARENKKNK
ncbi:hypothetical protein [Niallia oryzisoli]